MASVRSFVIATINGERKRARVRAFSAIDNLSLFFFPSLFIRSNHPQEWAFVHAYNYNDRLINGWRIANAGGGFPHSSFFSFFPSPPFAHFSPSLLFSTQNPFDDPFDIPRARFRGEFGRARSDRSHRAPANLWNSRRNERRINVFNQTNRFIN